MNKKDINDLIKKTEKISGMEKADTLIEIGDYYENTGDYDKAFEYYNKAVDYAENENLNDKLAVVYHQIGVIHYCKGDYNRALEYYLKSLEINKTKDDKLILANGLCSLGVLYYSQKNLERALEYFNESLIYYKALKKQDETGRVLSYIGSVYKYLFIDGESESQEENNENLLKALDFYEKSYEISREIGFSKLQGYSLNHIGTIYMILKEYDKALEFFEKALEIRTEIDHKRGASATLSKIGKIHQIDKEYDKAYVFFKKSLEIAEKIGTKALVKEGYENISSYYEEIEDFENALKYYKKYSEIKDEIYDDDSSRKLLEMQTKYETEKKEKEAEIYRLKNIELAEMNDKLKKMQSEMIELEQKNSVLAMTVTANHELNQPLTVLKGNLKFLGLSLKENLTEKEEKYLSNIEESLSKVQQILNKYKSSKGLRIEKYSDGINMVVFEDDEKDENE